MTTLQARAEAAADHWFRTEPHGEKWTKEAARITAIEVAIHALQSEGWPKIWRIESTRQLSAEITALKHDLEAAKEALSSLAERAGALVVATDGMEHIRSERLAVLAASTAATDFLERLSCED